MNERKKKIVVDDPINMGWGLPAPDRTLNYSQITFKIKLTF